MAAKENPAFENDQTSCEGSKKSLRDHGVGSKDYSDLKANIPEEKTHSERCGLGFLSKLRPLQAFAKIEWFVVILCIYCCVEGASINGFVSISLSTIEKRFQFQSSESGLILSSADIGAAIFVLFVSYYGGKGHKPRVIGAGCLVMAVGSFLLFLPHILVGKYVYTSDVNNIGHVCDTTRPDPCSDGSDSDGSSSYLPLFAMGQALQGIGFTPAFTVGAAYVDENTTPDKTAVYMGIIYALTALGVAVGYMTGGQLLNVWVDAGRVDPDSIPIDPTDKRWLGAWWLGFTITTGLFVILALPLASFPSIMPMYLVVFPSDMKPVARDIPSKTDDDPLWKRILSFPKAVLALLKNVVFVMIVLVGCMESLLFVGLGAFSAKILEEKFDIKPDEAGLIMGAVTVVGGAGGMILGGVLIRKFHMTVQGILKLCLLMALLALVLGGGFFLNCPETKFAGLTSSYNSSDTTAYEELLSGCNSDCRCLTDEFDPVCGNDDIIYFSPCHAGCDDNVVIEGQKRTYTNCSCVSEGSTAINGECPNNCPVFVAFIILLFFALLATFTTATPISIVIMRCVPEDKRSLGLGVQWACFRLLGTIPGPVLTGYVLDNACDLWQTTCQGEGNCWVYDRYTMSWSLFAWWAAVKSFAIVMLAAVLFINRTDKGEEKNCTAKVMNGTTQ